MPDETSELLSTLQTAVRDLYRARLLAAAAKREWLRSVAQYGQCEGNTITGVDWRERCFHAAAEPLRWCVACQHNQPLWEAWQDASRHAGNALRRVLRIGKLIHGSAQ